MNNIQMPKTTTIASGTISDGTPATGKGTMLQKNAVAILQAVVAITGSAVVVSTLALLVAIWIVEAGRYIDFAGADSLFDLVAAMFLTLLNLVAVSGAAFIAGAKVGLVVSAALSVGYLLMTLAQGLFRPSTWRWTLVLLFAVIAAVASSWAASMLATSLGMWFSVGMAIYGAMTGYLLPQPPSGSEPVALPQRS